MSIYQVGRLGKVYVKKEITYGVAPTFAATDALRHLAVKTSASLNRSDSLERRGTPGLRDRFSRHIQAGFQLDGYLQPSGTIQTIPEAHALLESGFGVEVVGTGSSTVASGPSTTGATVASATGFAAGQMISITELGGATPGVYNRLLTQVSGSALTWAPALPTAVAVSDTIKSMVTYKFANELPYAFTLAHYLPNLSVEVHGNVMQKFSFMFDANDELKFSASGPGKDRIRNAQTVPGSFTTVGTPVTGILGAFLFNGVAYQIMKATFEVDNAEELQNDVYGTASALGFYRGGRRKVTFSIDARVTDDVTVITQAEAASDNTLLITCGNLEGKMATLYAPRAEFDVPDSPDGDGALTWSFKGVCKETLAGAGGSLTAGNDELFFGI